MASSGSQAVMPTIESEVDAAAGHRRPRVERPRTDCAEADAFVADGDGPHSMRLASITFFGQLR